MAIPVPAGITRINRLRVAGRYNEGEIGVRLWRGGWDAEKEKHMLDNLLDEKFDDSGPYNKTFSIDKNTVIDPEYHTLALVLWGTQRTSISLVAVEYEYN